MTEGNGHHAQVAPGAQSPHARRRTPWPLAVVAALFVIVPFAFWYGTWFGRSLDDAELTKYLKEEDNPRHEQHALAQIAERMEQQDANVRRWYPQVVALAASKHADVRMTAAWVMGRDASVADFHAALLKLITDDEPIVRRNAALALVPFGDARARAELVAMLRPYTFNAPVAGRLISILPAARPSNAKACSRASELMARNWSKFARHCRAGSNNTSLRQTRNSTPVNRCSRSRPTKTL